MHLDVKQPKEFRKLLVDQSVHGKEVARGDEC